MSRTPAPGLPSVLAARLDGRDPGSQEGFTVALVTTDQTGWPHVALLSAGEVLFHDEEIRLGLWPSSTTTDDLTRDGRGLLHAVDDGAAWLVRLAARRGPDIDEPGTRLAAFRCRVEDVQEDRVGYAVLRGGISFTLNDREKEIARWRRTIDALRRMPG